jgi:hypothetical protein
LPSGLCAGVVNLNSIARRAMPSSPGQQRGSKDRQRVNACK